MESDNELTNAVKESKYNSGIDKIYTMSQIRKGCHDFKIARNFFSWYQCLRAWRSEMNSKLEESEQDMCNQYHLLFDSFFSKKSSVLLTKDKVQIELNLTHIGENYIDNALYDYELYLGDLMQKYKMGMPDAEDDEGL